MSRPPRAPGCYSKENQLSSTPKDLDPRLIIMATEASNAAARASAQASLPQAALLVLSRVGLHIFTSPRYAEKYPYTIPAVSHALLADVGEFGSLSQALPSKVLLPLGLTRRAYRIGFVGSRGYTTAGELMAGIANLAKSSATHDIRERFLQALAEARQQCPPFQSPPGVHPHIARMRWFIQQSAFGPALDHADMALQAAELQRIRPDGPGFFQGGTFLNLGWSRTEDAAPRLTPVEIQTIRRERAWLLLDGSRFATMAAESENAAGDDPEILVAHSLGYVTHNAIARAKALLQRAGTLRDSQSEASDPVSQARVLAGIALGTALDHQPSEARALIDATLALGNDDRQMHLLLGCVYQQLEDAEGALRHFLISASHAHGYFEGDTACSLAYIVAHTLGNEQKLATAERLTRLLPDHISAWQALALAARDAGDTERNREVMERVAAMESGVA